MERLGAVGENRLAVFLGTALPILPFQILWINMSSSVAQGLVLALEQREPELMSRPFTNAP